MAPRLLSILALAFAILLLSFASATERAIPEVTQYQCANLKQSCGNCTYVNITSVSFPNGTVALSGPVAMTKKGTEYNYTFCTTNALGVYIYHTEGNPDGIITPQPVSFEVTPTGFTQTTGQSIIAGIALIIIAILAGFCLFIAFKFIGTENLWFFGVIVLAFGLIFSMYALNLGLLFTRDIAYTTGTFDNYEQIFVMANRLQTIVVFLSIILFLIYAYKLWKKRKKAKEDNDGWDNNEY